MPPGQIAQLALVATVNAARRSLTERTVCRSLGTHELQTPPIFAEDDTFQMGGRSRKQTLDERSGLSSHTLLEQRRSTQPPAPETAENRQIIESLHGRGGL
jgi:hypothetical protein